MAGGGEAAKAQKISPSTTHAVKITRMPDRQRNGSAMSLERFPAWLC